SPGPARLPGSTSSRASRSGPPITRRFSPRSTAWGGSIPIMRSHVWIPGALLRGRGARAAGRAALVVALSGLVLPPAGGSAPPGDAAGNPRPAADLEKEPAPAAGGGAAPP